MCEVYGFCGSKSIKLNKYTDEFWLHSRVHRDGFGFYLADKNELYVNPQSAIQNFTKLSKKSFTSKLALCHIRFKTHGDAKMENCHPFSKYDIRGTKWTLIHNGYIEDNDTTVALSAIQDGETDSERILMYLVEHVNRLYEHAWLISNNDLNKYIHKKLSMAIDKLSSLGKVNLIFTDDLSNNMYVYMNHPNTLFYLKTDDGYHISTTKLSDESWLPVPPYKLHVFNNGSKIDFKET